MSKTKNDKSDLKQGQPKSGRRFSQEQYDLLVKCSLDGNIERWKEWRKAHPDQDVLLEGADFRQAYLRDVLLNTSLNSGFSGDVHLEQAKFHGAILEGADFSEANLKGAKFIGADLGGADFRYAYLQGADFRRAIVDGSTVIWRCRVNRHRENKEEGTDFNGVGLANARLNPGTKLLLEYNIRRMNWEGWYKEHRFLQWPFWLFWLISDYGLSTGRILLTFFVMSVIFAGIYWLWPCLVMVYGKVGGIRDFLHALYFSVVTMTTLGFGDIAANPESRIGQVLLMVQVILGYVLLGALVTRFAVLFTAGGPAGTFSKRNEKKAR